MLPRLLLLSVLPVALALPQQELLKKPKAPTSLPVVLWHGLGDTYDSKGMASIAAIINETYPGTFIHSIYMDEDPSKDRNAGFIGHLGDQVTPPRLTSTLPRMVIDGGVD